MQNWINGYKPRIMIIDDVEDNIRVLGMHLQNNGYTVEASISAKMALEQLKKIKPDLILLDIMMPEIDGYELCRILKQSENTAEIPIIFVTARTDEEALLKSFEAGGVDFISKPFNPKELLVRIKNHLDLKLSKQIISAKVEEITEINRQLSDSKEEIDKTYRKLHSEILSAAEYVQSVLPDKINDDVISTDWLFEPSQNLGGDSFGYHWLDSDNLAIYLLDVSGHGVASALQSVSVLNMLRFATLPNVDFRNPAMIFSVLNKTYPIQKHNYLFFTLFYAVFNKISRKLTYAAAGQPPALLIPPDGLAFELPSQNMLIGTNDKTDFTDSEIEIKSGDSLIVYSDGLLDPYTFDFNVWNEDTLRKYFEHSIRTDNSLDNVKSRLIDMSLNRILKDDISVLKIKFK